MEQGTLVGTILAWFMLLFAMTFNFATLSINAGNVQYFWDTPSLMIVFGGTIASTFISHPMGDAKGFLGIIGKSWKPNSVQLVETLTLIIDVSKIARKNILAIEVHNYSTNSSDLSCIPFLTLGYNEEQDDVQEPHPSMTLPNSYLHTNFKISSSGEDLILSDDQGNVQDSIYSGEIETDMSFGRYMEGETWNLFAEPTPNSSNSTQAYLGALSLPIFSIPSSFYDQGQEITVSLSNSEPSSVIHFTLDGTEPTINSLTFEYPIQVNSSTVIRARAFLDEWLPSKTESKTYIFGVD